MKETLDSQITDSITEIESQLDSKLSEWSELITNETSEKVKLELAVKLQGDIQELNSKVLELEGGLNTKVLGAELGLARENERAEGVEVGMSGDGELGYCGIGDGDIEH